MLPLINLQSSDSLILDTTKAPGTHGIEGPAVLEGGFSAILTVRIGARHRSPADRGETLPPTGRELPLLPLSHEALLPGEFRTLAGVSQTSVADIAPENGELLPGLPLTDLPAATFQSGPMPAAVDAEALAARSVVSPGLDALSGTSHSALAAPGLPAANAGKWGPIPFAAMTGQATAAEAPLPAQGTAIVGPTPATRLLPSAADTPLPITAAADMPGLATVPERPVPRSASGTPGPAASSQTLQDPAIPGLLERVTGRTVPQRADTSSANVPSALPRHETAIPPAVAPGAVRDPSPRSSIRANIESPPMPAEAIPEVRQSATVSSQDETAEISIGRVREEVQVTRRPASAHAPNAASLEAGSLTLSAAASRALSDPAPIAPKQPGAQAIAIPVQQPGWDKAMATRVLLMANGKIQNAEFRLSPPDLGALRVQLAIEDGTANVSFQAQHALTREALEQAIPRLRDMLAENGLSLGHADVSDGGVRREAHDGAGESHSGERPITPETGDDKRRTPAAASTDGLVDTFA